jgi:predicted nuclease of restriction endonuclease-like (RecB) superfamily
LILSRCKYQQEREFYLRLAHREGWDKRETERQLRGALFERAVLVRPKVPPPVTQLHMSLRDQLGCHATGARLPDAGTCPLPQRRGA